MHRSCCLMLSVWASSLGCEVASCFDSLATGMVRLDPLLSESASSLWLGSKDASSLKGLSDLLCWSESQTPRMNHRFRLCGAPTSDAVKQPAVDLKPSRSKSQTTLCRTEWYPGLGALTIPSTFSKKQAQGRRTASPDLMTGHKCRGSLVALRRPDELNGWQGKPPLTRSTHPRYFDQGNR